MPPIYLLPVSVGENPISGFIFQFWNVPSIVAMPTLSTHPWVVHIGPFLEHMG